MRLRRNLILCERARDSEGERLSVGGNGRVSEGESDRMYEGERIYNIFSACVRK